MKQTLVEMILAILAFQKDGKIEVSYDNGKSWQATVNPSWNFSSWMYRPVKAPQVVKYLCYEHVVTGLTTISREGGSDSNELAASDLWKRVPELDREVTR